MNTFGPAVRTDDSAPPFGNSHMLIPTWKRCLREPRIFLMTWYHSMTAMDLFTPLDSGGLPVYRSSGSISVF